MNAMTTSRTIVFAGAMIAATTLTSNHWQMGVGSSDPAARSRQIDIIDRQLDFLSN
jgi:hypothetical protein